MSLSGGGERSKEVATAPACCKVRTMALPIPPDPPVTTAVLPANSLALVIAIPPPDQPAYDDDRLPTKPPPARRRRWRWGGCGFPRRGRLCVRFPAKPAPGRCPDRKSTRLNSSHLGISYAVFCLKKKTKT